MMIFFLAKAHIFTITLCSLPNIIDEIAKEDEEKEKRRLRRTVVKEERLKSGPPRLGRHKYNSKLTDYFSFGYASYSYILVSRNPCWKWLWYSKMLCKSLMFLYLTFNEVTVYYRAHWGIVLNTCNWFFSFLINNHKTSNITDLNQLLFKFYWLKRLVALLES